MTVTHRYRGPAACHASGITYRQLDYWARTGLAEPSILAATGSGSQRLYSRDDIVRIAMIRMLLDLGMSLPFIRQFLDQLREYGHVDMDEGGWPVARLTLDPHAVARVVDERLLEHEEQAAWHGLRVVKG